MFPCAAKVRRWPDRKRQNNGETTQVHKHVNSHAMTSVAPNVVASNAAARLFRFVAAVSLLISAPGLLFAQTTGERPVRHEVWDIPLGARIADLPDDYVDYA